MSSMGGGVVARLRAIMGLDTKEFEAGIKNAKGGMKDFQKGLSEVAAQLGVAFSVGALVAYGKEYMDWAGRVSHAAVNVGILTNEMLALNGAAVKEGIELEDLTRMMAKIEESVFGAANGTSKLSDIYGQLGFSIDDLVKMSPEERFLKLSKAAMESANATGALAQLFGQKLGPKANNALREILEGLDKVDESTGNMIDKVDAAGDAWAGYMDSFKSNFLTPAIAGISTFMERYTDAIAVIATTRKWEEGVGVLDIFPRWMEMGKNRDATESKVLESRKADLARQKKDLQTALENTKKEEQAKEVGKAIEKAESDDQKEKDRVAREKEQREEKIFSDWWSRNQKEKADWAAKQVKNAQDRLAIERQIAEQGDRHAERLISIQESAQGRGVNPDSMARMGGFAGGERAGLAALDRQINVQIETARAVRENSQAIKELTAQLPGLTGNKTGVPD